MTKKDISKYQTDENVTRLIAFQVITILLLVLFNNSTYLLFILTADFAIRAFTFLPSPLTFVAKLVVNLFRLKPKPIFAAPKKFAAAVGFVFSLSITVLLLLNLTKVAYIVSVTLILFALLEAVFKICVGCYVYNWLLAPIAGKQNAKTKNL